MKEPDINSDDGHSHHIHGYVLSFLVALLIGYAIGMVGGREDDEETVNFIGVKDYLQSLPDYKPLTDESQYSLVKKHGEKYTKGRRISAISEAQVPGWYEVLSGDKLFYMSHDRKFLFEGDLVDTSNGVNLTSLRLYQIEMGKQLIKSKVGVHRGIGKSFGMNVTLNNEKKTKDPVRGVGKTNQPLPAQLSGKEMSELRSTLKDEVKSRLSGSSSLGGVDLNNSEKRHNSNGAVGGLGAYKTSKPTDKVRSNKIGYNKEGAKLSEIEKREQVIGIFKNLKNDYTINYPAIGQEKGTLVVFSDYTCPHCKTLHKDIPKLNERGVAVRVMFYPRHLVLGENERSLAVMENMRRAWCAPNQGKALNELYNTNRIQNYSCKDLPNGGRRKNNPIKEHFYLGQVFDLQGTPHSFTNTGKVIMGYSDVNNMLNRMGIR